jgi:MFS family permease
MNGGAHRAKPADGATYVGEFKRRSRGLLAAMAGLAAGFLLNHYVANLFAPHLVREFGWSKSDFALVGTVGLLNLAAIPVVGRLTDLLAVRRVAFVGVVALPLTFVALSMMTGSIVLYTAIMAVQYLLCGATTTSTVYSRLVAERFVSARGLALAFAATSPALVGMVGSPILQLVIDSYGWRVGFLAVAGYVALMGSLALALIPSSEKRRARPGIGQGRSFADYRQVFRSRAFWIVVVGMLLCNLLYPLQSSQMKLMLLDRGVADAAASTMIALFAAGVLMGRFICGAALDRFPAPLVAAVALGLPGIGLVGLACGLTAAPLVATSVMLLGASLGAESDLVAFLVMRFFRLEIYATVLGLVVTAMALSGSIGAVLLSLSLNSTGGFELYMLLAAGASLAGALTFLMLGRREEVQRGSARLALEPM